MNGLLKYNYAELDATGVAHDNIDGILAGNRQKKLEDDIARHGSIGPTPFIQSQEGQQALMDVAMGSAFPGAAVGRVSKAAVTGGQKAIGDNLANWVNKQLGKGPSGKMSSEQAGIKLKKYFDEMMGNAKKPKRKPQIPYELEEQFAEEALSKYNWNNKLNAAKLKVMKAYEKHELPFQPFHFDKTHPLYKSQTADDMVDNVTLFLNRIKRN